VFGKFARIPTDGIPQFLFYLSGNIIWRYFADCLMMTSKTFLDNARLFGKVYFPRLTVPASVVITNIFQFCIQFSLFLGFYAYFIVQGASVQPNVWVLSLPLILLQMALLGIGTGILISSLTTKYRDLMFALNFGIQLWMYATPVVYPLSQVPAQYRLLFACNPMVSIVESFRYAFLGASVIEPLHVLLSWVVTLMLLMGGIILFSRIEKTFMDTV
jgi:lipopolysaccharide transport system permease protein